MVGLFAPSEPDLERLRSTVRSLRATSVPGIAAALSWRTRKAEKLLAYELARPGTPLVYEPGRRLVRWAPATPVAVAPPPAQAPAAPVPPAPAPVAPRVARAPPPVLTSSGLKTLCPHCHVPLLGTGSANLAVCPECGRLATPRNGAQGPAPEPSAAELAQSISGGKKTTETLSLADRHAQELFAAYVTSKPIPCPKCRTPLRHRSLSEYGCPSCGQLVRFPAATTPPSPPAAHA
jgi:predicted RNA-binding Zn-ribbon protein involved in translation (DUF1610 family)